MCRFTLARLACQNVIIFISRVYETNSFLGGLLVRRKILGACYVKLKVIRMFCGMFETGIYFEKLELFSKCLGDLIRVKHGSI